MHMFLGIDGGGSSTRALLADDSGRVLGEGLGGPSNLMSVGTDVATQSVEHAVDAAWRSAGLDRRQAGVACMGMAGMAGRAQYEAYSSLGRDLDLGKGLVVLSDLEIALTGGLGGDAGMVLIAGTGSSCLGRDASGRTARAGGRGALAGDSGSGYWIGHRALRTAVKQMDGRLASGPLLKDVLDFLEIAGPDDVVERIYGRGLTTAELARLAPRVVDLAHRGDPHADAILRGAYRALAEMAVAVGRSLDLDHAAVLLSGGVALASGFRPGLEAALLEALRDSGITVRFADRRLSPAAGAVLEAMRVASIVATEDVVRRLAG